MPSRHWYDLRHDALSPSPLRSVTIPWVISPSGSIPVQRGKPCSPSSAAPSATRPLMIAAGSAWPSTAPARVGEPSRVAPFCRPKQNAAKQILGYQHSFVMVSVVGTGLSLPCDGEPYGSGDSEYAAGQRLLRRVIGRRGKALCAICGRRWRIRHRTVPAYGR